MPCFSLSQAATWPAVRQCPAFSPAWSSACTLASATGLGLPGGASRSNNWATPPAVKSSSHTWMVERARPASRARSASVCWPLVAQLTTCNRSLSRGSVVARICVLSCVVSVALSVSLVRFLPMPKFACSPHRLPAFIPTINPTSATGDDGGLGELILLGFCGGGRQRSPLHRPWVQLALG